ncbi:MAG: glycosyltransferase family 1 protein [Patescibacteria group bacterium]|nr:glycosyltransferase family 1 protein [Patescibacteria group bacterium]
MRIGVDIRGFLTGKRSGIEQYTINVLTRLITISKDKPIVWVLFYVSYKDLDKKLEILKSDYPILNSPNVEVKSLDWPNVPLLLHFLWKIFSWPKTDKVSAGLDVMWQVSPRLLPVSSKCKTIITFHDLVFDIFPQFYNFKSRLWQWQMNYRKLGRGADKIIAVSDSTKNDLVKIYNIKPEKIEVIYEGVGDEYLNEGDGVSKLGLQQKFNIPEEYLYYVGSLEPRKNLIMAVRGLNHLKANGFDKIKLVLSGSKSWLTKDLSDEIDKLQLSNQVILTGSVTEKEKIGLLKNAKIFVFPTFYEGFGLPVLEAFACKLPVISSNLSSIPEIAEGAAALVDPYNQNEFNEALVQTLTDPEKYSQMQDLGLKRAKEFTWGKTAEKTLKVLYGGE